MSLEIQVANPFEMIVSLNVPALTAANLKKPVLSVVSVR